jgi:hypothetical protein
MEQDKGKEEEKFDFVAEGEGYISLAEARVLAVRTAVETPGDYGRQYRGVAMVFEAVESGEDEDFYNITLSVRPQGNFAGSPGQEQFVVGKEGTIAFRQVLSFPTQTSGSGSGGGRAGGFPVIPVAIGLAVVGAIVAAGFVFLITSSGGDSVPIAAVTPTETPGPIQPPAPTFTPTPRPTATPTPRPTATPTPRPTATPTPRPTATPTPRPRPTRTPIPSPTSTPVPPDLHGDTLSYATPISLDYNENPAANLRGRIQTKSDVDYFEFWISDTRKMLVFSADFLPFRSAEGKYPGLGIYNNYGNLLAITTVYSSGYLSFEPSSAGYYYLAVNSGTSQKTSKYRVLLDLIAK